MIVCAEPMLEGDVVAQSYQMTQVRVMESIQDHALDMILKGILDNCSCEKVYCRAFSGLSPLKDEVSAWALPSQE